MKTLIAALLLSATPALALDLGALSETEKDQFGTAVRDYLMENPEVLIEAMNALEQRRLAEETKNDAAMIAQLSDQIYNDGHSWIGGNPEGDVTVVEFIDYRCGVCKQVFPMSRIPSPRTRTCGSFSRNSPSSVRKASLPPASPSPSSRPRATRPIRKSMTISTPCAAMSPSTA